MVSAFIFGLLATASITACFAEAAPPDSYHKHILQTVGTLLKLHDPDNIQDAVFGLLGGETSNIYCLQRAVADRAFSNAKMTRDTEGQVAALSYLAVARRPQQVGPTNLPCITTTVNPEIDRLIQFWDSSSVTNKALALELAKQIDRLGGNPLDALKAHAVASHYIDNASACENTSDPIGCRLSQDQLFEDLTEDDVNAAVAGSNLEARDLVDDGDMECFVMTVTVTSANPTDPASSAAPVQTNTPNPNPDPTSPSSSAAPRSTPPGKTSSSTSKPTPTPPASNGNLQKYNGAAHGIAAPAVTASGNRFVVEGNGDFNSLAEALNRSCDVQHNECANEANSSHQFPVSDCDKQNNDCKAQIQQ